MSRKTVPFKMPAPPASPVDSWVANRGGGAATAEVQETAIVTPLPHPAEVMKRFTIDVTEDLHKRIKAQCAMRGDKMADAIRDILEREFPKV
jgi:hypothetical protein